MATEPQTAQRGYRTDVIGSKPESLSERERRLAELLWNARTALWREWVETGSEAAKAAYDATDPGKMS